MGNNFLEEIEEGLTNDDLELLSHLVKQIKTYEQKIENQEETLKELKKNLRVLTHEQVPELLMSKGISTLELTDGTKVAVQEKISVKVPRKDVIKRQVVLDWLRNNGGSSLIDNEVVISEPRTNVFKYLEDENIPYKCVIDVNHQRFLSFVRTKLGLKKNSIPEIEASEIPAEANPYLYYETNIKE